MVAARNDSRFTRKTYISFSREYDRSSRLESVACGHNKIITPSLRVISWHDDGGGELYEWDREDL